MTINYDIQSINNINEKIKKCTLNKSNFKFNSGDNENNKWVWKYILFW